MSVAWGAWVPRLAALAARRTAPATVWFVLAAVALLVGLPEWAPLELATPGPADPTGIERAGGLERQAVWAIALLVVVPLLVYRAARVSVGLARDDADWLASRAIGRGPVLLHTWAGAVGAALVALLLTAAFAEVAAPYPSGRGPLRFTATMPAPPIILAEEGDLEEWAVGDPKRRIQDGAVVRVRVGTAAATGPAADVRFGVARRFADETSTPFTWTERRVSGAALLAVDVPPIAGDVSVEEGLHLAVEHRGQGAVVGVAEGRVELFEPSASAAFASVELVLRLAYGFAAWIALAMGFAMWTSAPSGALLVLALWTPAWLGAPRLAWMPTADLVPTLRLVGEGVVPGTPGWTPPLAAAGFAAVGLGFAHAALRDWRKR